MRYQSHDRRAFGQIDHAELAAARDPGETSQGIDKTRSKPLLFALEARLESVLSRLSRLVDRIGELAQVLNLLGDISHFYLRLRRSIAP